MAVRVWLWLYWVTVWAWCIKTHRALAAGAVSCSAYSASDQDSFWDALGKCPLCLSQSNCGFCVSTLQCLGGAASGPDNGTPCPQWTFGGQQNCPAVPNCGDHLDCAGCAKQDECAWCASENACTTISDAFSRDCRGLVFEPPCPDKFVADNVILGNLIVTADPTFGGGELNVTGDPLACTLKPAARSRPSIHLKLT